MVRQSKNLSLEPEAVRRAERYAEVHGTTVSQLVNGFMAALPLEEDAGAELPPVVRRLVGAAAGGGGVEDYRAHLAGKYAR